MASLRKLKKHIDYHVMEVIADCDMTMYFHPEKREKVVEIMQKAVQLRNDLYERANNPVEKNNPHLVRKHYMQVSLDLLNGVNELFESLSVVNK